MFMCHTKWFSVIDLIYSGQELFSTISQYLYFLAATDKDLCNGLKSIESSTSSYGNPASHRIKKETVTASKGDRAGNNKGGSITVLLTSCLTGLD